MYTLLDYKLLTRLATISPTSAWIDALRKFKHVQSKFVSRWSGYAT